MFNTHCEQDLSKNMAGKYLSARKCDFSDFRGIHFKMEPGVNTTFLFIVLLLYQGHIETFTKVLPSFLE
jgi:hypothetical protein